jgi:hypothetical protein
MSSFSEMTDDELREAHDAAGTLLSGKFRSYLPGADAADAAGEVLR